MEQKKPQKEGEKTGGMENEKRAIDVAGKNVAGSEHGKQQGRRAEEIAASAEHDKKQLLGKENNLQKEFAELKETLQRVQAEFENSRKRLEKEKQDFALVANFHLVKEMLPVLDSIDAAAANLAKHESVSNEGALKTRQEQGLGQQPAGESIPKQGTLKTPGPKQQPASDSISKEKALQGIELIKKQLLAILSSHGLQEMKSIGERFDPMLHECVMQGSEKEKQDNFVLLELQKGYLLNGRVLRHAKVKVNKKRVEDAEKTKSN